MNIVLFNFQGVFMGNDCQECDGHCDCETSNPDPSWNESEQLQAPTKSHKEEYQLTEEEYKALAEFYGACGEGIDSTEIRDENDVEPTIAKDENTYDYKSKDKREDKQETEGEKNARIERENKQKSCSHKNKYINKANLKQFWVCPDCKADLGNV
jgi:hypothetical protein